MKNKKCFYNGLIAIILAFSFVGCREQRIINAPPKESDNVSQNNVSEKNDLLEYTEENDSDSITNLLSGYRLYLEYIYNPMGSIEIDYQNTYENGTYCYVIDDRYNTWEKWMEFLGCVFTEYYIHEETQNEETFKEINGFTYCRFGSMGWYMSDDFTWDYVEKTENEAIVTVQFKDLIPGEEEFETINIGLELTKTEKGWRINRLHERG